MEVKAPAKRAWVVAAMVLAVEEKAVETVKGQGVDVRALTTVATPEVATVRATAAVVRVHAAVVRAVAAAVKAMEAVVRAVEVEATAPPAGTERDALKVPVVARVQGVMVLALARRHTP